MTAPDAPAEARGPRAVRSVIAPDPAALAERVAADLLWVLADAQSAGRVPALALTGGGMGIAVLRAIAAGPAGAPPRPVDWSRVRLLWGDERWLPAGDPERNDRQADDALLAGLPLSPGLVHRVPPPAPGLDLAGAAAATAAVVAGIERIDLVLLGVGPDAHVASLFPGQEALLASGAAAIAVPASPKPPAARVSLSRASLNRADRVWFLIAGAEKAAAYLAATATADGAAVTPETDSTPGAPHVSETIETSETSESAETPETAGSAGEPGPETNAAPVSAPVARIRGRIETVCYADFAAVPRRARS